MLISPVVIGIIVATLVLIWLIAVFNGLVALRNRVQNAWAQIDVQLKRRHDLIPSLVETVRGYMQHERSVFDAVTEARAQAIVAGSNMPVRTAAESALSGALGKLFAVAENYPQLRAVENFQILQEELTSTENRIAYARQCYNDEVMKFNTTQSTFPRNLFVKMLGFSPASMFAGMDADRAEVQAKL
jgi:LemA protein